MTPSTHDWITLHRMRFAERRNGTGAPLPGPLQAKAWRFYPSSSNNETELHSNISDIWGGVAVYDRREDAEAGLGEIDRLSWISDVVERWDAIAVPINHHGITNWRGELRDSTTLHVADVDPGGPLVVLTTAGYSNPGPADMPRIDDFVTNVARVTRFYRGLPGNRAAEAFSGAGVDGHDGATITIWTNDAAMRTAAYKSGLHKDQMNRHRDEPMFDRSSWTRARIVGSSGAWDGYDPAAGLLA